MKKPELFSFSEEAEEKLPHQRIVDDHAEAEEEHFMKKDKLKLNLEFNMKRDKSSPSVNLSVFAQDFGAHATVSDKPSFSWNLGFPVSPYLKVRCSDQNEIGSSLKSSSVLGINYLLTNRAHRSLYVWKAGLGPTYNWSTSKLAMNPMVGAELRLFNQHLNIGGRYCFEKAKHSFNLSSNLYIPAFNLLVLYENHFTKEPDAASFHKSWGTLTVRGAHHFERVRLAHKAKVHFKDQKLSLETTVGGRKSLRLVAGVDVKFKEKLCLSPWFSISSSKIYID